MKPTISIIIPTWNTATITLKCVKTIQKFLPKDYAEIIIVDNGSTDETQAVFEKLKNVIYLRNDSNLGFSKGNNVGAKKATAPYLFFLNSDMEMIDHHLPELINYLDTHPQVGLIGPQFLNPDLTVQGSVLPPQTPFNAFKEYWLKIPLSYTKYAPQVVTPTEVWAISGGAVIISKENFDKIHGWDEKYFFYYEDLEMCRQIRRLSLKIVYYPQCQVIHRHGASGVTVASPEKQWRRLIPSSIKYHGYLIHHLINFVIWSSQKFYSFFDTK